MNFFHSKKTQKSNRARTNQRPLFLSPPFIDASLVDGSFKKIVVLPKYVDEDEWLAVNVFEFFNYLNMFYGTVTDFCTPTNCPTMSAGPKVFAHIYYHHYEQILHLREEKQFNSLFAHFISFAKEFNLLSDKKELAPLEELITYMENNGRIS
ncbi:4209_t:CDS:2 [Dentiscutata erythropus]|uniref:4209_t:CDS:1 n=1 Tax=Dentiscutata erythropus TaxID=1348616 RepID=A0A9N9IJ09_9GLOM|nr:4209_t:CDS:2 [Dentiscutata erythropus]